MIFVKKFKFFLYLTLKKIQPEIIMIDVLDKQKTVIICF